MAGIRIKWLDRIWVSMIFAAGVLLLPASLSRAAAEEPARSGEMLETAGKPDDAAQAEEPEASDAGEQQEDGSSSGAVSGTAVLVGAGALTYMRLKWKEKKTEQKYEYFENHTKNGTLRDEEKYPL